MGGTAIGQNDFEALLVSELETLQEGEKFLKRLHARLTKKPQLRKFLLRKLTRVHRRIDRIQAVLNPTTNPAAKEFS